MTVAEAQDRVSAREFSEWMAYYRLEPFGEFRADYRMGILASITTNQWKEKGDTAARPEDFLPVFGTAPAGKPSEPHPPPPTTQPKPGSTDQEFEAAMLSLGKGK